MIEKLVELMHEAQKYLNNICCGHSCDQCPYDRDGVDCGKYVIADYLIDHGVTFATDNNVGCWIPVTDPPKERGCYLITVKHWLDGKPVTREAKWNGTDWLSCYRREEITPRVTHWMPMPEPPKGE